MNDFTDEKNRSKFSKYRIYHLTRANHRSLKNSFLAKEKIEEFFNGDRKKENSIKRIRRLRINSALNRHVVKYINKFIIQFILLIW